MEWVFLRYTASMFLSILTKEERLPQASRWTRTMRGPSPGGPRTSGAEVAISTPARLPSLTAQYSILYLPGGGKRTSWRKSGLGFGEASIDSSGREGSVLSLCPSQSRNVAFVLPRDPSGSPKAPISPGHSKARDFRGKSRSAALAPFTALVSLALASAAS